MLGEQNKRTSNIVSIRNMHTYSKAVFKIEVTMPRLNTDYMYYDNCFA